MGPWSDITLTSAPPPGRGRAAPPGGGGDGGRLAERQGLLGRGGGEQLHRPRDDASPAGLVAGPSEPVRHGPTKTIESRRAEMVYRRYHKFSPNLRGRDGAHAARWLATEGL
jgi:hypothetical protein